MPPGLHAPARVPGCGAPLPPRVGEGRIDGPLLSADPRRAHERRVGQAALAGPLRGIQVQDADDEHIGQAVSQRLLVDAPAADDPQAGQPRSIPVTGIVPQLSGQAPCRQREPLAQRAGADRPLGPPGAVTGKNHIAPPGQGASQ